MATADDDYTPREIARALRRLEEAVSELRHEVATLGFVRQDVWAVERDAMRERIEQVAVVADATTKEVARDLADVKDNLRWLVRAVAGIVLTAVLTAVLVAAGIHP